MLRSFMTLAVALPMAIVIGYMLATGASNPDYITILTLALVLAVLAIPYLLKNHHLWLIFSWNMTTLVFILPGRPNLWLVMAFVSLGFVILQRAIDPNKKLTNSPSIVWPLVVLGIVVVLTAFYRGGFGLRAMGSDAVGGRRYLLILGAIAGYIAMSGRQIPKDKVWLYVGLFFLGGLTNLLADALPFVPQSMYFIFWMFPVDKSPFGAPEVMNEGIGRYYGLTVGCLCFCFYLMARYGIRGMLEGRKIWRFGLLMLVGAVSLFGGFRSFFILAVFSFIFHFYFEGMLRSRYTPFLIGFAILTATFGAVFPQQLPMSVQRAISFLPLDVDPLARLDALSSSLWRKNMWESLIPEIDQYWIIGKGYTMNGSDLDLLAKLAEGSTEKSAELASMAGDYHNGPLSVLLPFGILGTIAFLWFFFAAFRGLYFNWRYGDLDLIHVNSLLLALFCARGLLFFFIFGGFYGDIANFVGLIGFSVSLNGGIRQPVYEPVVVRQPTVARPRIPMPQLPRSI